MGCWRPPSWPSQRASLNSAMRRLVSTSNRRSGVLPAASDGRTSVSPGSRMCGSASAIAAAWMRSLSLPNASRAANADRSSSASRRARPRRRPLARPAAVERDFEVGDRAAKRRLVQELADGGELARQVFRGAHRVRIGRAAQAVAPAQVLVMAPALLDDDARLRIRASACSASTGRRHTSPAATGLLPGTHDSVLARARRPGRGRARRPRALERARRPPGLRLPAAMAYRQPRPGRPRRRRCRTAADQALASAGSRRRRRCARRGRASPGSSQAGH